MRSCSSRSCCSGASSRPGSPGAGCDGSDRPAILRSGDHGASLPAHPFRPQGLKGYQPLAFVVLPPAVRNVLPDLVSNTVEVVKLTSIASVVALPELLYSAYMARSVAFNSSPIVLAAAIYRVMLWPIVRLISRLERRGAAVPPTQLLAPPA